MKSSNLLLTAFFGIASISVLASTEAWTYDPTAKTLSWTDSTGFENVVSNVSAVGKELIINGSNGIDNTLLRNADFSVGIEDGYSLVRIGGNSISGNLSITNMVLPSTMRYVDWFACCNLLNLETLILNEGLVSISDSFRANPSLKNFSGLPSTLTAFGSPAFVSCTALNVEIDWPEGLTTIKADFASTAISAFRAPKGLISIDGYAAFGNCTNLSYILLSDVFEYAGRRAFGDNGAIKVNQEIYFRCFPKRGFDPSVFDGGKSRAMTIHMEWGNREEWTKFAETNTVFYMDVPATFSGEGLMGKQNADGSLNDWSCIVNLKWWQDPEKKPMPLAIIIQ
ncbi:MAG: leucine-rich repeat domain-containing protein [Kiritimatiellae bacterium]|nr:leucine-rich repeat domain-containing protein [Kiritimatiellia bacterium]